MTPLGTFPLTINSPVNINVQQRGGVVELLNYSPYDLSMQGPFGQTTLSGGTRVGYANPQYGMQIVGVPAAPGVTLNTSQVNLVANWYDASELQPYPPTSMGNLIQAPGQGGGNVQQATIYIDTVAAGGTLNISTQVTNVYIYGFDITGDKSAAVNTGKMSISGLYDPKSGNPLGTNPSWWINQGPNGTAFMDPRFPTALQGSGPSLAVPVVFHFPAMSAGVGITIYLSQY